MGIPALSPTKSEQGDTVAGTVSILAVPRFPSKSQTVFSISAEVDGVLPGDDAVVDPLLGGCVPVHK
jgi:hypothetical protein